MAAPRRPMRRWTQADAAQLRELHAQGQTLTAIAKAMDRSTAMISRYAAQEKPPLTWDRTKTMAATQAKQLDAKARRATLQLRLLEDAERLREQLWQPCIAFNFGGKDNTYEEHHLDKPTFADQLKIMQATGVAVDRSLKLADHDSAGSEVVKNILGSLAEQLGLTDRADAQ